MKNNRKTLAFVGIAFLAGLAATYIGKPMIAKAQNQEPDALRDGNPDQTEVAAKNLLTELKNNGWDPWKVEFAKFRVSDQNMSQNPRLRGPEANTFIAHGIDQSVYGGQVAFWTDLYTRVNKNVAPGHEADVSSEGFYIVGWKDGHVSRVPVAELRYQKTTYQGNDAASFIFPGMTQYANAHTSWPY